LVVRYLNIDKFFIVTEAGNVSLFSKLKKQYNPEEIPPQSEFKLGSNGPKFSDGLPKSLSSSGMTDIATPVLNRRSADRSLEMMPTEEEDPATEPALSLTRFYPVRAWGKPYFLLRVNSKVFLIVRLFLSTP
jgi:hypothetical protein